MSRDSLDDVRSDRYQREPSRTMQLTGVGILAIVLYVLLVWAVIALPETRNSPLRFVIAIPLLLFLPGYSFLSTLFPGRQSREAQSVSPLSRSARFGSVRSIEQRGLTWGERVALSFGMSLVWLPILALLLTASPWSLTTGPILATLAGFVLLFSVLGAIRRARLTPSERFVPPYRRWLIDARGAVSGSAADTLLTGVLALSVLAALASIGYAMAVPTDATTTTDFYVGTSNSSGVYYQDYPETFTAGQPVNLTVGLENHEQRVVDYTIIGQFQRVQVSNGETTVLDRQRAVEFTPRVETPPNNQWNRTHQVTPPYSTSGEGTVRLVYLAYTGDPPADPTIENADYAIWVWPGGETNANSTATGS